MCGCEDFRRPPDAARLDSNAAPETTTHQQTSGGTDSIAHRDAYRPSEARLRARAALSRGRRCTGSRNHDGEIAGQLDIFDALGGQQ